MSQNTRGPSQDLHGFLQSFRLHPATSRHAPIASCEAGYREKRAPAATFGCALRDVAGMPKSNIAEFWQVCVVLIFWVGWFPCKPLFTVKGLFVRRMSPGKGRNSRRSIPAAGVCPASNLKTTRKRWASMFSVAHGGVFQKQYLGSHLFGLYVISPSFSYKIKFLAKRHLHCIAIHTSCASNSPFWRLLESGKAHHGSGAGTTRSFGAGGLVRARTGQPRARPH